MSPAAPPRHAGAGLPSKPGLHLLWISDSPTTPSGFGNVTRFVCEGLARRGHEVHVLGWQVREPGEWNGCRLHPPVKDPMGSDALYSYLLRHRPDVVIALADVWWLPAFAAPHVRRQLELTGTPWLLYFPIDGHCDDGRLPGSWVQLLSEVDVPVAMSRYGQEVARRCGVDCAYIPHGVDTATFAPPADREAAKAAIGAEGRFVVLSDSRNQPRKLLPRLLDVFSRFAEGRPDALLLLHTDPDDEFARSRTYSYDVRADVRALGLEDQVRFTPGFSMDSGLPLDRLAALYQVADVHLLASSGEGFGLPTLQAAAAGAVPLAAAYSASLELVEGHGEAIDVAAWAYTEFGVRRALLDVDDAVERLAALYDDRAELAARSRRAREFAVGYGWPGIVDQWDALVRSLRSGPAPWWQRQAPGTVIERELGGGSGAQITVRMVERQFGRLEVAIAADAERRSSDVRLPSVPAPCELEGRIVERRPGLVCAGASEAPLLAALEAVFPCLCGWDPAAVPDPVGALAESVLVLDSAGELPAELVAAAERLGVPRAETFAEARALLTDPSRVAAAAGVPA